MVLEMILFVWVIINLLTFLWKLEVSLKEDFRFFKTFYCEIPHEIKVYHLFVGVLLLPSFVIANLLYRIGIMVYKSNVHMFLFRLGKGLWDFSQKPIWEFSQKPIWESKKKTESN